MLLAKNRIEKEPRISLQGGVAYVKEYAYHSGQKTRNQSLDIFSSWDMLWVLNELYEIAKNEGLDSKFRKRALEALSVAAHPRRIVLLERLLSSSNEEIQENAYRQLASIFSDSLRAQELATKHSSEDTHFVLFEICWWLDQAIS